MMTIYTANGSQYSINQTTHTITGKHMNPLHFYGTPDVRLGFPAYFHTDRGTWRTSAVMKIENGPAHVYKLFSSTDKQLEPFITRYAYSGFHEEPTTIEMPLQICNGSDLTKNKIMFQTMGSDVTITMYPKKVERGIFMITTQYGDATVFGMKVYTAHHTHIFYEDQVHFS